MLCYSRLGAHRSSSTIQACGSHGSGGDDGPADAVVAEIAALGGRAVADHGSVADEQDAQAMIMRALQFFGRLDIVVNNAGVFVPGGPFEDITTTTFRRLFDVHVLGTVNVTRLVPQTSVQHGADRVADYEDMLRAQDAR